MITISLNNNTYLNNAKVKNTTLEVDGICYYIYVVNFTGGFQIGNSIIDIGFYNIKSNFTNHNITNHTIIKFAISLENLEAYTNPFLIVEGILDLVNYIFTTEVRKSITSSSLKLNFFKPSYLL